jgi:hypothetical protein
MKHLLSPSGSFYLVAVKANSLEDIQRRMQDKFRLTSEARIHPLHICMITHDALAIRFVCNVAQDVSIYSFYGFGSAPDNDTYPRLRE